MTQYIYNDRVYEEIPEGYEYVSYGGTVQEVEVKAVDYTKPLEVYHIGNPDVGYKVISSHTLKGWNNNSSVVWENGGFEYANNFDQFGIPCKEVGDTPYRVRNKRIVYNTPRRGGYMIAKSDVELYAMDEYARVKELLQNVGNDYRVYYVSET